MRFEAIRCAPDRIAGDSMADSKRWRAAWREIGATPREDLVMELIARHGEPGRAYHTIGHVEEGLEALLQASHLAERRPEVELAIWFHDAIYDTHASDNEERSAEYAAKELRTGGADEEVVARIERLILATKHDAIPEDGDARLLVDIDLAILGSAPGRFDAYERQIREEYAWVPEADFRAGRARLLRSLLDRPRIYATDWFHDRLEEKARANLERSLRALES